MRPSLEYDYKQRCFTGRKYVLVKVYNSSGDHQEWDKLNHCLGRRYFVRKRYV
jgi:hypothetical protein